RAVDWPGVRARERALEARHHEPLVVPVRAVGEPRGEEHVPLVRDVDAPARTRARAPEVGEVRPGSRIAAEVAYRRTGIERVTDDPHRTARSHVVVEKPGEQVELARADLDHQ